MSEFNQNNAKLVIGDLPQKWGWLLALGLVFIILGTIGLGLSVAMTVVTILFFGVLLLIGGVVQIFEAFKHKGWKSILGHVLIAAIYLLAGIMLITEPVVGSMALTALLAAAFIITGLFRIFMGFQLKGYGLGWGWLVFAGVISLALGVMIFFQWPESALWFIGLMIAIEMIFHGWAYVMLALAVKSLK
ncbi:HdeD family acid-resistance protein [Marinicella gelatinilytica]|uniref:HdeD family acid-resistance protein n=1 Tax=Marinicella gelatinilytica TaxID=2996017 RepID=UPI002260C3C8|nr:HdeD family acid-resistance protein [Marinicella gelatinilytica]MCX7544364.1 HdeD family acid-resistance protein [Marinicella gelatinilytica]